MRKLMLAVVLLLVLAVAIIPAYAQDSNTIADIVVASATGSNPEFTTLLTAVQAADLVGALSGPGPFTVFAPTDAAFAALGADTINALVNDVPALTDVLLYHVVSGAVPASQVVTLNSATTLQGSPVSIEVRDGAVFLNNTVQVITTDIQASNGIIHVIDAVLLPPFSFGPDDLYLVIGDGIVLAEPNGAETSGVVETCQTFFVTDYSQGFVQLAGIGGGWVDARLLVDVAEDYGQPGGQEKFPGC